MAENEPIKYSDLIAPDDSLEKLVKQLDEISSALQLVQKSAVSLNESMKTMSGATSEGRGAIAAASKEAEKLAKAQADLAFAESETARKIAELKEATREQNNLNKLAAKEANSAAGSYNALSAQYSRLKMILNQMSEEERKNTAEGRKMVKQAEDLYAKMNELQKATGKFTLQVGNYELAGKSLRQELRQLTQALTAMKLEGKENSEEYAEMVQRAGELRDAMQDAGEAINRTASDTSNLDAVLGGASAVTGGFGLAIGAMSVLGVNTESVEKAQKKLQEAIALVNSVQAISNALNKDSALMTKLRAVAQKLLNKTMEESAVATNAATTATNKWKIALMTTGIGVFLVALGALVAVLSSYYESANEGKTAQDRLNDAMERGKTAADNLKTATESLGKAQSDYNKTTRQIEEDEGGFDVVIKNLNADLEEQNSLLTAENNALVAYQNELTKAGKKLDAARQNVTRLNRAIGQSEAKENAKIALEEAQAVYDQAEANIKGTKANIKNLETAILQTEQKITQTEKDQEKERESKRKAAIENAKKAAEKRYQDDLRSQRALLDLQEEYSEEAYDIQYNILEKEREHEIKNGVARETAWNEWLKKLQDLDDKFDKHRDELSAKELERIKKQKEEAIKSANEIFDAERALSEYWNETSSTENISVFTAILEKEEKALSALDKLADNGVEVTDEMYQKVFDNTKKQIDKAQKELKGTSVYSLLGFDLQSEQEQAINTAFQSAISSVNSYIDSLVALKQQSVDTANARVESAQKALDAEIEARNAGYANNVETAQKELQLAKENQRKAEQEAKRMEQVQRQLDTLQQASSLVTATANIWKSFTGTGNPAGIALAMTATATMWGAFAAAKIKAAQVTRGTEKYGEGTVELLSGGSHASGNDIDLGMKTDGTRRRAEGGEFFAVINKRNSRKYRKVIPDVIRSINNDTFASKYLNANGKMAGALINIQNTNSTDLRQLQDDVRAIKKASEKQTYIDARGYMVQINGNSKRIIRR